MVSAKVLFALVLAIGASQAANIKVAPQPRDIEVVLEDAVQILRIVSKYLDNGIAEAEPVVVELENSLEASLGAIAHTVLSGLKTAVGNVTETIATFDDVLLSSIDDVQTNGGACVVAAKASLEKTLKPAEAAIAATINNVTAANQGDLESLLIQLQDILRDLDEANTNGVKGVAACIKQGAPDAEACLKANNDAFNAKIERIVTLAVLFLDYALTTIPTVLGQALPNIQATITQLRSDILPTIAELGVCLAKGKSLLV